MLHDSESLPSVETVYWFTVKCSYDYGLKGTDPSTMSSAPLTKDSFHKYEDHGKLHFEGGRKASAAQGKL